MSLDVARLANELTRMERSPITALDAIASLDISRGRVTVITGAPGAGKSSLIQQLLRALADRGERVAAVLIDPSSPVTGGAVLGDRLRMLEARDDVFIRSLAALDGNEGVGAVAPVMAWTLLNRGFEHVFIESVGIGQQELDVASRGDVLALVLGPDSGDWVQFLKGGVLDLCDLVAVSKADLDTRRLANEIRNAVRLQSFRSEAVPVIAVSTRDGTGIEQLIERLDRAHAMDPTQRAQLRAQVVGDVALRLATREARRRLRERLEAPGLVDWRARMDVARDFIERLGG